MFVLVVAEMLSLAGCKEKEIMSLAQPQTAEDKPAAVKEQVTAAQEAKQEAKMEAAAAQQAIVTGQAKVPPPQMPTQVPDQPVKAGNPVVVMKTSKGQIKIELYPDKAPVTVANFLTYVKSGHYNGTIFHRVIPGFMIQGGGMTPNMQEKPTRAPIKNEAANGLKNDRGTIAMARTNAPDSATSQFFINVANNAMLNYVGPGREGYAVFGKVTEGMDVADAIVNVPRKNVGMHQNVPVEPIVIESITLAD
jgi:cyclophilin family peptidyl-prolyl cis-trans isomerase/outer membrane murein-binding lipoprotein Lpp